MLSGCLLTTSRPALHSAAAALTARLCVLQWEPDGGFPAPGGGGPGEEAPCDPAVLYDNLPSPKIFARCPPAARRASRPPADGLSRNHYRHPASCSLPSSPSVTNTSSLGRASLGLSSQVRHPSLSSSRTPLSHDPPAGFCKDSVFTSLWSVRLLKDGCDFLFD